MKRPVPAQSAVLDEYFQRAVSLHQAGQIVEAVAIYRQLLSQLPKHGDLLFMLGTAEYQLGNKAEAVELLDKSVASNPGNAMAFNNRGNVLQELSRFAEALKSYDQAIRLHPGYFEAYNNKGNTLRLLGQPENAIEQYQKSLALKPDYADAYNNWGNALQDLKRLEDAIASFQTCVQLNPNHSQAFYNWGNALKDLGRFQESIALYQKAIELNPLYPPAYNNLGYSLKELHNNTEAAGIFQLALQLQPDFPEALNNLGTVLTSLDRLPEARDKLERATHLKPDYAEAHSNLGVVLLQMRCLDEALTSFDRALSLQPGLQDAQWNRSLVRLTLGDYANGWRDHEARVNTIKAISFGMRSYTQPRWTGVESLSGKTIFVAAEQGLGDTIQFCRYVPMLARLGARVIFEVQPPLVTVMKKLEGPSEVVSLLPPGQQLPEHDFYCMLMSLPLAFNTTVETIPAQEKYLEADRDKVAYWASKLGVKTKLRVGLVWSGGFRPAQPELWATHKRRNIELDKLAGLKNIDAEFYSLQKGQPAEGELESLVAQHWDGPDLINHVSELRDFSDTAALIENLDLIVAVDTSTPHLAAALGKPTWLLSRFDSCWRWLDARDDTPWYPTMRLFRQKTPLDWGTVIETINAELSEAVLASQ